MEQRISLKDIEVLGEYARLKKKKLRACDSKFKAALEHQTPPGFNQDFREKPIIDGVQKYLTEMQSKLEELFRKGA